MDRILYEPPQGASIMYQPDRLIAKMALVLARLLRRHGLVDEAILIEDEALRTGYLWDEEPKPPIVVRVEKLPAAPASWVEPKLEPLRPTPRTEEEMLRTVHKRLRAGLEAVGFETGSIWLRSQAEIKETEHWATYAVEVKLRPNYESFPEDPAEKKES